MDYKPYYSDVKHMADKVREELKDELERLESLRKREADIKDVVQLCLAAIPDTNSKLAEFLREKSESIFK